VRRCAALSAILLLSACTSPPPPSGSSTDEIYKDQRAKRQSYTESSTITACSDSGCYPLPANITHIFQDGKELKRVNRIDFPNGGYIEFTDAYIGGSGTDSRGRAWTFRY
jgi:hypothetical protein